MVQARFIWVRDTIAADSPVGAAGRLASLAQAAMAPKPPAVAGRKKRSAWFEAMEQLGIGSAAPTAGGTGLADGDGKRVGADLE